MVPLDFGIKNRQTVNVENDKQNFPSIRFALEHIGSPPGPW
jgi:hypothetical protein